MTLRHHPVGGDSKNPWAHLTRLTFLVGKSYATFLVGKLRFLIWTFLLWKPGQR